MLGTRLASMLSEYIPLDEHARDQAAESVANHGRNKVGARNGVGCAGCDLKVQGHGKHELRWLSVESTFK